MGNRFDTVIFDRDAVKRDMGAMGITAARLSAAMGKHGTFVSNLFRNERVERANAEAVAVALFKDKNAYIIPEPEKKVVPEATTPTPSAEQQTAVETADQRYLKLCVDLMQELVKNTSVIRAQNEEIIGILHADGKTLKDQNGLIVEKINGVTTQIMKVRSAIDRAAEEKK